MFKITNFHRIAVSLAMFAVVAFGSAAVARADNATFQLNRGSTLPDQNYGTVTLTIVNGNQILVEINLLAGNRIVTTGHDASFAFNQLGNTDPQISVSGLPATYTLVNSGNESALKMNGFGTFEFGVSFNNNGGGAGTDTSLSFTLSRVGGFASVFDLVSNSTNPPGSISSPFAVDIICDSCQGKTGVIGTTSTPTPPPQVPEPASMLLLGTGLAGIAGAARRKLKARS